VEEGRCANHIALLQALTDSFMLLIRVVHGTSIFIIVYINLTVREISLIPGLIVILVQVLAWINLQALLLVEMGLFM